MHYYTTTTAGSYNLADVYLLLRVNYIFIFFYH